MHYLTVMSGGIFVLNLLEQLESYGLLSITSFNIQLYFLKILILTNFNRIQIDVNSSGKKTITGVMNVKLLVFREIHH